METRKLQLLFELLNNNQILKKITNNHLGGRKSSYYVHDIPFISIPPCSNSKLMRLEPVHNLVYFCTFSSISVQKFITTLLLRNRQHSFYTNDTRIRNRLTFLSSTLYQSHSSSFTQKVHYGCPLPYYSSRFPYNVQR